MRKYLVIFMIGCGIVTAGSAYAADGATSWDLPGVNIVTRAQWGADETMRYSSRAEYDAFKTEVDKFVTEDQEEQQKQDAAKSKASKDFALANFPQDILIDKVVDTENGNSLWWPLEYKYQKTKIIVHHTVNDMTKFTDESSVMGLLRSVYKMHAFTNGWGDIGYNFLISPNGVIYEGRAGGPGIVGAHASWNNQPSLGIALVGNFNIDKPTDAQINALVSLISALAKKYNIDPESKTNWHRKITAYPYVSTFENYAVVGHRDVGPTACPGDNLYKLLPAIRDRVELNVAPYISKGTTSAGSTSATSTSNVLVGGSNTTAANSFSGVQSIIKQTSRPAMPGSKATGSISTIVQTSISSQPTVTVSKGTYMIRMRIADMKTPLPKCQLLQGNVTIAGCAYRNGELIVAVKTNNSDPGIVSINASSRTSSVRFSLQLTVLSSRPTASSSVSNMPVTTTNPSKPVASTAPVLSSELQQRRANFPITPASSTIKISMPLSSSQAPALMKQNVSVLLYNASTSSSSWTFTCSGVCNMSGSPFTTLTVSASSDALNVQKNGLVWKETNLMLTSSSGSTITIADGITKHQYGIYRGNMNVLQQKIKKVDGTMANQFAIINVLPMSQYLAGIAEASDAEPIEKTKVLALLTKAYALYYVGGSGPHPSIPAGASFNAIDDPRFFQKYVGVTWESKSKNWPIATEAVKNQYVTYNNILPILPYFHCSPGFTWSAREKWGWTDTPYLQSVLDDSGCSSFEGHGVGLSGQGATKKAQSGQTAEDIIKYYYQGAEVKTIY